MKKGVLIILFFAVFLQFVNADIVSLNSGGDEELIINPDAYIEGFFSGDGVQVLSSCGNGILETPYEECDDGNFVSGDGCSATCTTEVVTPPGGGGGITPGNVSIVIKPREINLNLAVNTNKEQKINITNNGATKVNLSISQQNLTNMIILPQKYVEVSPGETVELNFIFVALSKTGIFTGKIMIGGRAVYVSLNVKTKLLLFDSNIIVLNEDYLVPQGDNLKTSVTLIPLGDKERIDVTLNYVIKDYEGRVYLTRSETVLVENQVNFKRNFDTGFLPLGKYIVGLELIYPNGVAPSSAHFEVTVGRQNTFFGKIVFFLVNLILIILILIIILIILRILKQMRENKKREEKEKLMNKEK
ncbi:MAG: myxococcus cysteine-rich repeat containing protein [Nanoarchaeota archaeon]